VICNGSVAKEGRKERAERKEEEKKKISENIQISVKQCSVHK
jgi:hypothetical protein